MEVSKSLSWLRLLLLVQPPHKSYAEQWHKNTTAYRSEQKVHADFDNRTISYSSNVASGTKALDKTGKVIETSEAGKAGPVPTFNKSFLQKSN